MQDINTKQTPKMTKKTAAKGTDVSIKVGSATFSRAGVGMPTSTIGGYSKKGMRYLPFSNDSLRYPEYNLYPQQIARMMYDSPTNGAALYRKAFMTKGKGFDMAGLPRTLTSLLNDINGEGETINDVLKKVAYDYCAFGGFALKITWGNDAYIRYVEHIPFTFVRCGEPNLEDKIDYYLINNNWDGKLPAGRERCYALPNFNPSYFKDATRNEQGLYSPSEDQIAQSEQLIYFYDYKPFATNGQLYYPVPDYVAGLDAIETEASIGIANKSRIDNGMGGKTIIQFPFKTSLEEKQRNDQAMKDNFGGAYNDGAMMSLYTDNKDHLPTITSLPAPDANTYVELEKSVKQSIITSHSIPAILLEYNYGGGFNNRAEEMTQAYDMFQRTIIQDYQIDIISVFNRIITYMGWTNVEMSIIPFTLAVEVTPSTAQPTSTETPQHAVTGDSRTNRS